jgi:hypothetical protein
MLHGIDRLHAYLSPTIDAGVGGDLSVKQRLSQRRLLWEMAMIELSIGVSIIIPLLTNC